MTDNRLYENDDIVIRQISEEDYKVSIKPNGRLLGYDGDIDFTLPISCMVHSEGGVHFTYPLDTLMSGLYRFLDVCYHSGQLEDDDYYNPDM